MLQLILEGSKGLMALKKKCARYQRYHAQGPRPDPGVLDRNAHFFMLHVSTGHPPCVAPCWFLLGMMRGREESAFA